MHTTYSPNFQIDNPKAHEKMENPSTRLPAHGARGGPTRYSVSSSLQRAPRRSRCSETQTERDTRPRDEPKCAGKTLPDLIGGYVRGSSLPLHRIACSQVKSVLGMVRGLSIATFHSSRACSKRSPLHTGNIPYR